MYVPLFCLLNFTFPHFFWQFSPNWGQLSENLVGALLYEKVLKGEAEALFYWKNRHEVDFVLTKGEELLAINVSLAERVSSREKEGLLEFAAVQNKKEKKLLLLTGGEEGEKEGICFLPLWRWLIMSLPLRPSGPTKPPVLSS